MGSEPTRYLSSREEEEVSAILSQFTATKTSVSHRWCVCSILNLQGYYTARAESPSFLFKGSIENCRLKNVTNYRLVTGGSKASPCSEPWSIIYYFFKSTFRQNILKKEAFSLQL